jgi:tetratricopeptide (TPR) repeat protein
MARRTSDGLEALVQYDRIDLSVEQRLILDEDKIYAPLVTAEDRAAAREKLADWGTQIEQLARDRAEQDRDQSAQGDARVAALRATLPVDLAELRTIAAAANEPEEMIAANQCILEQQPNDVVALNRLGRAFEAVGWDEAACVSFEKVLEIDPGNAIAKRRLQSLAAER